MKPSANSEYLAAGQEADVCLHAQVSAYMYRSVPTCGFMFFDQRKPTG
jgi:hypothetical protein